MIFTTKIAEYTGQGVIKIPDEVCKAYGIKVGDAVGLSLEPATKGNKPRLVIQLSA